MAKPVKAVKKYTDLNLTLVGMGYRLNKQEIQQLDDYIEEEGGIPCTLQREPSNEVDPLAVKVVILDPKYKLFNGREIGYVRRPANEPLSKLLRRGATTKLCLLVFIDAKRGEGELEIRLSSPSAPAA